MTSGVCSRCGTSGIVEYGSDGLAYCNSCAFFGLNKQCYRCRMYLPAAELQQYRGQWMCPYCVQDMRDEDRKAEAPEPSKGKPRLDAISYTEQCERCGRDLDTRVYIWNGKRLCKPCVDDEQQKWGLVGGGPMGAPYKISLEPEKKRRKTSAIEALISDALHVIGIKRKGPKEIIVMDAKMPIQHAKPMAEKAMESGKKSNDRKPQAEGLMGARKTAAAKSPPQEARSEIVPAVKPAAQSKPPNAAPVSQNQAAPSKSPGELSRVVPGKTPAKGRKRKAGAPANAESPDKKKKQ